jgi:uncharacterized protein YjbI with pentapeptide repeats
MRKATPKLKVKTPQSVFSKTLKLDYKKLFTGLSKMVVHGATGQWVSAATDYIEALSAIGLTTEPGELASKLIHRSIIKALFELIDESVKVQNCEEEPPVERFVEDLDFSISNNEIYIDSYFLDRPSSLPIIKDVQLLLEYWLKKVGVPASTSDAIVNRFPSYFIYALIQEWRTNAKSYAPVLAAINTPFSKAGEREWAWYAYFAMLKRKTQESIFDESYSLKQIYVPLNAYYLGDEVVDESKSWINNTGKKQIRIVVSLDEELENWLENQSKSDSIRVISGGPGCGKSSFAKNFAANIANIEKKKVLFVSLHLIDPLKDVVDEVGRFVKEEGILIQNPLDPDSPEPNLLIIFDGLDELASQGRAAAEAARDFIREIDKLVEKRNLQSINLRVLISGRELVVQDTELEFRKQRQILNILPYYSTYQTLNSLSEEKVIDSSGNTYLDAKKLLKVDLRDLWWENYGRLTGNAYYKMPPELHRQDLDEITAQPLLNYLVALSYNPQKMNFEKDININTIYSNLIEAVYERGYESHKHESIRHMSLKDFVRVLEEIGLASWHGDGRSTTIKEIEELAHQSGLDKLLEPFKEGAKVGVTRLLAAFFFRKYGDRNSGDPTFIFTHKSFGEYLTSKRIVRELEKISRQRKQRLSDPDDGWDEKESLKHWTQITGPTEMSHYLHSFFVKEIQLKNFNELSEWQWIIGDLFNYMLRYGMPIEQLKVGSFQDELFQARNAEESLLVALNACSIVINKNYSIKQNDYMDFSAWLKRINAKIKYPYYSLALNCLSFINLSRSIFSMDDLCGSNFMRSKLNNIKANHANLLFSSFIDADLSNADLSGANLSGANLSRANLSNIDLSGAILFNTDLSGANLSKANLSKANLLNANLSKANLLNANLSKANLSSADLSSADLSSADLSSANLRGSEFKRATLMHANLEYANLAGADFEDAFLFKSNLEHANLIGATFLRANLKFTILEGVYLAHGKMLSQVDQGSPASFPSEKQ